MLKEHTVGELAYFDAFLSGLIKCKVIEVNKNKVKFKLTQTRNGYFRNEILESSQHNVIPRKSIKISNSNIKIINNYIWIGN
jgi:hypothetical protein